MRLEVFSFVTGNRRGKPLVCHQVIVHLITAATAKIGREVRRERAPASVGAYVMFKAAM
jgi:hypothetical protein